MKRDHLNLENVKTELKEIIIEALELQIAKTEIDGSDLINELSINSIDALEILVRVETKYDIVIPDEDLNANLISSLEGFAQYIVGRG